MGLPMAALAEGVVFVTILIARCGLSHSLPRPHDHRLLGMFPVESCNELRGLINPTIRQAPFLTPDQLEDNRAARAPASVERSPNSPARSVRIARTFSVKSALEE